MIRNDVKNLVHENRGNIIWQSLCWAILVAFSIVFYKERTCFGDASVIIIDLIRKKQMVVAHHRYTIVLMYFIPLLLIKAGAGLKAILIAFSLNQYVSTFLITALTILITKNLNHGWLFLLAQVFWVHESFYYSALESITYMIPISYFLISNYYLENKNRLFFYYSGIIFVVLIFLSSPNAILLFFLTNGLIIALHHRSEYKSIVFIVLGCSIGYLLFKLMIPFNGYESMKYDKLVENLKNYKHLDNAAMAFYAKRVYAGKWYYWGITMVVFITLIFKKQIPFLLATIAMMVAAHYICCIYNYQWETNTYMEMYYQMVGICFCILIYTTLFTINYSRISIGLILILFFIGTNQIWNNRGSFVTRVQNIEHLTNEMARKDISKGILKPDDVRLNSLIIGWALSFETVLLSTLQGKTRTIYLSDKFDIKNSKTAFYTSIEQFNTHEEILNRDYFKLKEEEYTFL